MAWAHTVDGQIPSPVKFRVPRETSADAVTVPAEHFAVTVTNCPPAAACGATVPNVCTPRAGSVRVVTPVSRSTDRFACGNTS